MEQRKSASEGQSGVPSTMPALPPWMHRTTQQAPDRRAKMLEHMACARSLPQPQAATTPAAPEPSRKTGKEYVADFIGRMMLFGLIGLVFQSRFPLCLGVFFFFSDGEFVEWVLRKLGIRLEPDTVGSDAIKSLPFFFGWAALLAYWKDTLPAWLVPSMPATMSLSFLVGTAFEIAAIVAASAAVMRRVLPWVGLDIRPNSLAWTTIQILVCLGFLALVDYSTSTISGGHADF
jgi:hypothetical protein